MWQEVKRVLIGVGHDPMVVASARATAYVVTPIIIDGLIVGFGHSTNALLLSLAPSLSGLLRVLEGAIDRQLKPQQNDINPPPVAGGGG